MKWLATLLVLFAGLLGALAKAPVEEVRYLSPGEMAISPDARWLYVICEKSDELLVVDAATQRVAKRLTVGRVPRGLTLSKDGRHIYVANSWSDTVSIFNAESLELEKTVATGFEPTSVVVDENAMALYVANRLSNDISIIDVSSGREIKRLTAGHGSSYLALSPDGRHVYATHVYPRLGVFRTPPESELTVIDTSSQRVIERMPLKNVAGVFHVAISADARLGVAAQLRPKNLIPLAHVEHSSVFGNSLAVFGRDIDGILQVPLDELDSFFAMPFGIAIAADNSKIFVTSAGSDVVTVIDAKRLLTFIRNKHEQFANDLSASANYVEARIPVGRNPRGLTLSPDGTRLYVANRMDDTVAVIDTAADKLLSTIALGDSKAVTPLRRGEQIFYSAKFAFQGQFGCANCHIDATFDGLEWDLEPDGFGVDVVDNRSIEDLTGTQPFKWNGGNPDLPTECGPRTEKFFYRSQSYDQEELTDLVSFVLSLPARPNRYRLPNHELTSTQDRGRAIFERTHYKSGRPIPAANQCATCHNGPKYTNQRAFDVGSGKSIDRSPLIDVPQLTNVANSAPYLHDGSARSLEEIWTIFNPKDTHGVTNDLTKDELNDLIEYLRAL